MKTIVTEDSADQLPIKLASIEFQQMQKDGKIMKLCHPAVLHVKVIADSLKSSTVEIILQTLKPTGSLGAWKCSSTLMWDDRLK